MPSVLQFLAFFASFSVILFGSHAFLYFAVRHFFDLGDSARRIAVIVLVLLSVSFIVASTVAHWYDNIFTRGFYYMSAVWLGVLSNAFFIFAILWIVERILILSHVSVSVPAIGWTGVVMIVLATLYGLINAANPVIREDTVYIRNLPAVWEGKKIVQINDVHLGHIIRSDFARKIVGLINGSNPAVVLIVGDLFDGMDGHLEWLIEPFNDFHSQYGTYFITGNHETYLGTGKTLDIVKQTSIHTIDDTLVNLDGLQLVGIGYPPVRGFPEQGKMQHVREVLDKVGYDRTKPSIVLYHTPTDIDTFRSLGVSLQLAGHTHRGQMYPYNLVTNRIFRGYDFSIYREDDYTLSVSSGVGTWGPPLRTNSHAEVVVLTLKGKEG